MSALPRQAADSMMTGADLRRLALELAGTTEAAHFDRSAFKVARIYATLAADGLTANLKLTLDEQTFKSLLAPEAFQAVPNAWGAQGWTTIRLDRLTEAELADALALAWGHAVPTRKASTARRRPTGRGTS